MKHLIAIVCTLLSISVVSAGKCDPSKLRIRLYQDKDCQEFNAKSTKKHMRIPKDMYYAFTGKCQAMGEMSIKL